MRGIGTDPLDAAVNVSICICTCNRPAMLERLLDSLGDVDLGELEPSAVEIVVVDNDPSGSARAVCERARQTLPFPIHFVEESRRGIAFARNRLVNEALARGADLLALLDDDDVPQRDWLRQLLRRQREGEGDVLDLVRVLDGREGLGPRRDHRKQAVAHRDPGKAAVVQARHPEPDEGSDLSEELLEQLWDVLKWLIFAAIWILPSLLSKRKKKEKLGPARPARRMPRAPLGAHPILDPLREEAEEYLDSIEGEGRVAEPVGERVWCEESASGVPREVAAAFP